MPQYGPYSPVRQAGNYYFISGQVGVDNNKHANVDVESQCHQALENLQHVLESAGLSAADVMKTTVFLRNMDDFTAVNAIYMSYFPEPRPARSCVAVADLPHVANSELLLEIEAIAYKEPQ